MSRVLVVEGWPRGSHQHWFAGWRQYSTHQLATIGWSDSRWSRAWRTSAAGLAPAVADWLAERPVDVVVTSGPVDTAVLRGLVPALGAIPVARMQHETELLYPQPPGARSNADAVAADVRGLMAADEWWFASAWHRQGALAGLPLWCRDHEVDRPTRPNAVIPIGVAIGELRPRNNPRPIVLWPHRWEHDKDPDAFARVARRVGADALFVLAGESPTVADGDDRRASLGVELGDGAVVGPFDRDTYRQWLAVADVVVSCARHDFYGLGVAEAAANGALPVVPDAMAYPEVIGCWPTMYEPGRFGSALVDTLGRLDELRAQTQAARLAIRELDWSAVVGQWDDAVDRLAGANRYRSPAGEA